MRRGPFDFGWGLLSAGLAAVLGVSLAAVAIRQLLDQRPQQVPEEPAATPSHTFDPPGVSPRPTADGAADSGDPMPVPPRLPRPMPEPAAPLPQD